MKKNRLHPNRKPGFTLIELLVALVVMTIALSIAYSAFTGTLRGWKRGMEVIDGIKHGDFAMTQLVSALNSAIYFYNPRKTYAFTFEKNSSGGLPADSISFVTSSGAFMPADSPFAKGPHRINLFIDDENGAPALFATTMPAIANAEEVEDDFIEEPVLVSTIVQGLEILFWDEENEDWTEEWEPENSLPARVLLTVFVQPEDSDDEPIEFNRVIEIPAASSVKEKLSGPTISGESANSTAGGSGRTTTVSPPTK